MGANTKQLRNRIKSVNSTLHLTKAMGLVASSKIRRATDAMNKSREYTKALTKVMDMLTLSPECAKIPYLKEETNGKMRIVVIAGDRGLAGGYNANIFRLAKEYGDAEFIPIGKRAVDRYKGDMLLAEDFSYDDALTIARKLCEDFAKGEYDSLGIISTKYVSMLTQEAHFTKILPLTRNPEAQPTGIIFEPNEAAILEVAITEYVAGIIVAHARESFASEVASRRNAMDSAGKNAQEMIDNLQLEYNRARQGAITQELTEIVAGSGSM